MALLQDQPERWPGVAREPGDNHHHARDPADHEGQLLQLHAQGDLWAAGVCCQHHARDKGGHCYLQCSGSMPFWCGSGCTDPCLWLMDPDADPDPAIFVIDLQDNNKKLIFSTNIFCLLLFEGKFTSFFKDKKSKRSHKRKWHEIFLMN